MAKPIVVGAVLYDPKVSVIWDIIREFFEENGCPMDVVFYTNYEMQVEALIDGHIDIAWNSPLAWLDSQRRSGNACRAIAMRDTDRDRVSYIVTRRIGGPTKVEDLRGKTIAVGAKDSPQATLIPLGFLQRQGLKYGENFQVKRFDVLVGKHGDHVGGELDAFKCLESGEADASTMLDLNWDNWTQDGTIDPNEYEIVGTTDNFDHCVFTVREGFDPGVEKEWLDVLFSMSYSNPDHQEMMDLEGLKEWMAGRTTGFGPLSEATEEQQFFGSEMA
ncbi:phosphate/phosphite/phosphonate ABC transporter substrate-binding protein [soil metagenome]